MKFKSKLAKAIFASMWGLVANQALAAEQITVYTAFETELLSQYKNAFERDNPDIEIKWVRDSIGIMTAKLMAEKNQPRADVVWGLAGASMSLLKSEGVLQSYQPTGVEMLRDNMIDPQASPAWFGNIAAFSTICFNPIVAKQLNLPMPSSWHDLTKPEYQGHIAMPNPASSGTGYMQVMGWISSLGEAQAWEYMQKLDTNIAHYTHSGSKPCVQAAMGEVAIGISLATRAAKLKNQGAPLEIIAPQGIGWDVDAVGLVKPSDAAKRVVDWAVSKTANQLYVQSYPVVGHKEVAGSVKHYPQVERVMANMDFEQMGRERNRVLATWSAKFDGKSEPQS